MAKGNVNLTALKPIMNILEMRMNQELAAINAGDIMLVLKGIEKQNEEAIKSEKYKKAVAKANEAIDAVNEVIAEVNKGIGGNAYNMHCSISKPYCSLSTKVITGKNKYDYCHMHITEKQLLVAAQHLEDQKSNTMMKYENIKAQIMLAGDYAQIRDILTGYGISLDAPVSNTEIADEA